MSLARFRAPRWAGLSVAALALAAPAAAQDTLSVQRAVPRSTVPAVAAPSDTLPLVLSNSGGISLGTYQAGVNWGVLELMRRVHADPGLADTLGFPPYHLAAATGASAGNINTLLWAVEVCTLRPPMPPETSAFWKFWVDVGLSDLFPRDLDPDSAEFGLLDRGVIQDSIFPMLRRRMKDGDLLPGCALPIGITLTRIRPDTLWTDPDSTRGIPIETQRTATVFSAWVDPASGRMRFLLPNREVEQHRSFGKLVLLGEPASSPASIADSSVFDAVEASSAFPVAFAPKRLRVWNSNSPGEGWRTEWYADGGFFDNNPINLAVELYAEYHPRTPGGVGGLLPGLVRPTPHARPETISLVYVNPGNLRGKLRDGRRAAAPSAISPGGLVSVGQLLSGAVPSARQYELQLWARGERYPPGQDSLRPADRDSVAFLLPTRGYPIVGEHLGAFAAFLGEPFREFDFYVGVYDALHFAAERFRCAAHARKEDREACVRRAVGEMIVGSGIDFGPVGPPLLAALLNWEYPGTFPDPVLHELRKGADPDRLELLLALFEAQKGQVAPPEVKCTAVALPSRIMCEDGFDALLRAWTGGTRVLPVLERRRDECRRQQGRSACAAEEDLYALARDPDRFMARTVDRLLARQRGVEREVGEWTARTYADSASRPGLSARPLAELVEWTYRTRPIRPPSEPVEWSPSSIPRPASPLRRALWALVPYHAAASLGSSGLELGYRPTLHLGEHWDVFVPLVSRWMQFPVERPEAGGARAEYRARVGAGVGVAARGYGGKVALAVPEVGVSYQHLGEPGDGWEAWESRRLRVVEGYTDVALSPARVRLALRYTLERNPLSGNRWGAAVGFSDLNGLIYWAGRLAGSVR